MITMLVLAIFFSMGSRVIFSPLMPFIQQEMGFNLSTAGFLFLLVNIAYGIVMLLSGFLSSRIGHGRTIVTALVTIAMGMAASTVFLRATPDFGRGHGSENREFSAPEG